MCNVFGCDLDYLDFERRSITLSLFGSSASWNISIKVALTLLSSLIFLPSQPFYCTCTFLPYLDTYALIPEADDLIVSHIIQST